MLASSTDKSAELYGILLAMSESVEVPNITDNARSGLTGERLTRKQPSTLVGSAREDQTVEPDLTGTPVDLGDNAPADKQAHDELLAATGAGPGDLDGGVVETPEFNPADHTVPDVNDYLETADEAERDRVLAAERTGQGRVGILGHND